MTYIIANSTHKSANEDHFLTPETMNAASLATRHVEIEHDDLGDDILLGPHSIGSS